MNPRILRLRAKSHFGRVLLGTDNVCTWFFFRATLAALSMRAAPPETCEFFNDEMFFAAERLTLFSIPVNLTGITH